MFITLETDYAVRIVDTLAKSRERMGAKAISEQACVAFRFSLKILRKLVADGIVLSYKGARGGYELARPPRDISIHDILDAIEGPYILNRCLRGDYECTRVKDKDCPYHNLFGEISSLVQDKLKEVRFSSTASLSEID